MALHGELELPGLGDARPASTGPDGELTTLADALRDPAPEDPEGDNPAIPAGYTYFGQFVGHDLTFDVSTLHDQRRRPQDERIVRTPRFDLDSVYASGPDVAPYLYARADPDWRLLTGVAPDGGVDLPRNAEGVALIGDPRNDDNVIVGQLHLAFLLLHNRIASELSEDDAYAEDPPALLREAQRLVRWHYQWVVVHDYLARIAGAELVERGLAGADAPAGDGEAVIPAEFSGAAFRFGHSQIRSRYQLNGSVDLPIVAPSGGDLGGRRPLPQDWRIDWSRFFAIEGSAPQPARRINDRLVPELFELPRAGGSLPARDLRRGRDLGLPSGEEVACRLGTASGKDGGGSTPLWLFVLREAEREAGGERLGPTGAALVASVVFDVLRRDRESWLSAQPDWRPELPAAGERFEVADLVAYALG